MKGVKFGENFGDRKGRKYVFTGKVRSLFGGRRYAYRLFADDEDEFVFYNSVGKRLVCDYVGGKCEVDFGVVESKGKCDNDLIVKTLEHGRHNSK